MDHNYKVVYKKTEEMLQEFILFTYRANNPLGTMKLFVLSLGLFIIGCLGVREKPVGGIILLVIATIFMLFTLFKHKIALRNLKKRDQAYVKQSELTYEFTPTKMHLYNDGELEDNAGGYGNVTCFYGDEKNYYVGVKNGDLYLLPRNAFVEGDAEKFLDFMQEKSGETYVFLPTELKNKWLVHKAKRKEAAIAYDEKAAALREEARAKKNKK